MPPPRTSCLAAILLAPLLILAPANVGADWLPNGTPAGHGEPRVAADGAGGAFVVSMGHTLVPTIRRLTADGNRPPEWPATEMFVRTYAGHGSFDRDPRVVADGEGGVYVSAQVNEDCRMSCAGEGRDVRLQRILPSGEPARTWPAVGVSVGVLHAAGIPAVVANGRHGVLVAWWSWQGLVIQALDPAGRTLWPDGGVPIPATGQRAMPAVVADGTGGAFVFWVGPREDGLRVLGQHVSASGRTTWSDARAISDVHSAFPTEDHWYIYLTAPLAVSDGAGGAIVAWSARGAESGFDIHAARVTRGGRLPWSGEVPVCTASGDQLDLTLVESGNGAAIAAWRDRRDPGNDRFYAQRITGNGRAAWMRDGISFCLAPGSRQHLVAAPDDQGGAYFAWADSRPAASVYATHLDRSGVPVSGWRENGTPVCARIPEADVPLLDLTADGRQGAMLVWSDCPPDRPHCPDRGFAMRLGIGGPAAAPVVSGLRAALPLDVNGEGDRGTLPRVTLRVFPINRAHIRYTLPTDEPASLELFDVAGRRLWSRELGRVGAGEHVSALADWPWLPRGLYLVRLRQGGTHATARLVAR